MNLSIITDAVAAGFEKAETEKPLNMKLTGASWTAIGSIVAICFGFVGLVDTVRKEKERPTLSDLCQAAAFEQQVALSEQSPAEMQRAAASRRERLAVLIDREVDRVLAGEREGGRVLGGEGRGWNALGKWKRVRRRRRGRGFGPLSWLVNIFGRFLAWSKQRLEQNTLS